jgi:SAM-dependent methyltransferase
MGFEVTGYELSRHLAAQGRQKYELDIRTGPFESNDFALKKIDLVTMWDVLEHIESPAEVLAAIKSSLRTNGHLLLNLPMIDTFSARMFRGIWPFYLEVHLHYFTMPSIALLLERFGFEIVYSKSYTQTLGSRYLARRATSGRLTRFPIDVSIPYRLGQRTIVAKSL